VSKEVNNSDASPRHKLEHLSQCQQQYIYSSKATEDAQTAPDVIIGMILVNNNGAIVLFDSGASHSFVAANFVQKHNLPLAMLKNWMIASSPRGDMHARHVCSKVSIRIKGVKFLANLIVLESNGIDVILGMD
jgi:hypothetical protein